MNTMKIISRILCSLMVVMVVAITAVSQEQTNRQAADSAIQIGTVTDKSPAVELKAVGKEVSPGVFEIAPDSIRGKRLMIPRGDQAARSICIGVYKRGECKGILIIW